MNHVRQIVLAMAIPAAFAATAQAQGPGRPTVGIFAGVTSVNGDFKDEVGNGWLAGGLIKMRAYGSLDLRADGTYVKLGSRDLAGTAATVSTDASIVFGTLNALLNLSPDSADYPGDNHVTAECTGSCEGFIDPGKKTHVGMNAGFGATVPVLGIRTFAEARYHRISRKSIDGGARSMILISVGVKVR
jgi:hypothetical protein